MNPKHVVEDAADVQRERRGLSRDAPYICGDEAVPDGRIQARHCCIIGRHQQLPFLHAFCPCGWCRRRGRRGWQWILIRADNTIVAIDASGWRGSAQVAAVALAYTGLTCTPKKRELGWRCGAGGQDKLKLL